MNALRVERSALVLVDFQQRLMPTIHRADDVIAEALFVAEVARLVGVPVLGTEQNPAGLGANVPAIAAACERTVAKTHFDACRDGLVGALRAAAPAATDVVVAGCEAHVCLLQTALGLRRAGYQVAAVASACGSRDPADRALALERLRGAGAAIVAAEMVAFEWLDACTHPRFKDALALLKRRVARQRTLPDPKE
jgi:nicotinamidase-related amidase